MSKIKIVFHRTYEIEEKDILEKLDEDYCNIENPIFSDDEIKEKAAEIATNLMSDEMVYFTDKLNDFMSYTTELISNKN